MNRGVKCYADFYSGSWILNVVLFPSWLSNVAVPFSCSISRFVMLFMMLFLGEARLVRFF